MVARTRLIVTLYIHCLSLFVCFFCWLAANVGRSFGGGQSISLSVIWLLILMYLLTGIGLTSAGSSTVQIYTQIIHRTTQVTTLVGRLSVWLVRYSSVGFSGYLVILLSVKRFSWFQTFAVFWMYAFFWVIPRRLNFICRRFGTLCLFHLHRWIGIKWLC
jgi:hypothetical protein